MTNQERIEVIKERLFHQLKPHFLRVEDESHQHVGHAGASTGAGHFYIEIGAESLSTQTRVKAHQMIYQALTDLIPTHIHALRIKIISKP